MSANIQSRKWFLTINNPQTAGLTHEVILDKISTLCSIQYLCMADEVGEMGTYHTHIYIYSSSNIRFNTIKRLFPVANIEKAYGSSQQNRDYVRKEGKYADSKKAETTVEGTFYEMGEYPENEATENHPGAMALIDLLKSGVSIKDIVLSMPEYALKVGNLEKLKTHIDEQFLECTRDVFVTYIYDKNDNFNLKQLLEDEGYKNVCCICEYPDGKGLFDAYNGQNVLVLTEFEGQIPINAIIHYLDGLPIFLPARFYNRVACYSKVYIISRCPLDILYKSSSVQWRFLSMIDKYIDMNDDTKNYKTEKMIKIGEHTNEEKHFDKYLLRKR